MNSAIPIAKTAASATKPAPPFSPPTRPTNIGLAASTTNNDATINSAGLDRLLHRAETLTLEGKSYRIKDQIEGP